MATQGLTTDMYDDGFGELLQASEPRRCMFDLEGRCDNAPVDGHFIQEGLLKLIRDSNGHVISFYNYQPQNWTELDVEFALSRPLSPAEAARIKFLCNDHEQFFWPVENPSPDWDNPEHKARLAYRGCLMNHYIKEWFITFASHIPFLSEVFATHQQQLFGALPLEDALREHLNGTDFNRLRHTVARVRGRPIIAASGVILHPPLGTKMYYSWDGRVLPVRSSPIVVTVLPGKGEQVAMFSHTVEGAMDAQDLLDRLEYHNGSIATARLSKKLIEELEVIHMSPRAWASLGKPKQEFITQYWKISSQTSEDEFDIPPFQVDLFAGRR